MLSKNRKLVSLIIAITAAPLAVLLLLGWRLLEQDRILEAQQAQQNVERAADLVIAALQHSIGESEQRLIAETTEWPEGAVAVAIRNDRIETYPKGRIAYVPAPPLLPEAPGEMFASGEVLEFVKHDTAGAIEIYRRLYESSDPAVRAGSLLRLGRNLDAARRTSEALKAYSALADMDDVAINAVPAALVGRYARCELLEREQRSAEFRADADHLLKDLQSGRWLLTQPVYLLYSRDAAKWTGQAADKDHAEAFSEALHTLWGRRQSLSESGQEIIGSNTAVLWRRGTDVLHLLFAAPEFVDRQWLAPAKRIAAGQHLSLHIDKAPLPRGSLLAIRNGRETDLPWSITVATNGQTDPLPNFVRRRRLMIAGFAVLVLMASIASYFILRAVNRELAVARLQADFVAAVSHEFRTPLTALRQFTEILRNSEAAVTGEGQERRLVCYDAQSRATDRLTRLVESLLDFGRMEAGVHRYEFAEHDCSEVVSRVVDDFQQEVKSVGYDVKFRRNGRLPAHVDRDALSRALRNLLENAVKYSPDQREIELSLTRNGQDIRIAVRDHGIGIPSNERAAIFSKFQRGEQAQKRGIKGTGIGLAMVDEIVKAHRGHVEVESEVGKGSTFTIVLPARG